VLGRASQSGTVAVQQLYGRLRYGPAQLTAGRRARVVGRIDTSLSMGSVTWSQNAPPPARISVSSNGYVPVPGTGNGVALKGSLTHGWLGEDRFVQNAFLHAKQLYLRLRLPGLPATAHAGLTHHAQWGGTSPLYGSLDASLSEWTRVALGSNVFSRSGRDADSPAESTKANHLAMYDFGLDVALGELHARVYRQFYHEDVASLNFRNVWDGLWGVSLRREGPAFVDALLWEHLRMTRHNARFSAGEERGADTYYNHVNYRGGWTYQGRTLGIPLLLPAAQTPGLSENLPGIGNNIVVAHHIGFEGHLTPVVTYQVVGTYGRNYGAQGVCKTPACELRVDRRTSRRDQWSFHVDIRGPVINRYNLSFHTAAAFDTGEFYEERFGLRLGLIWQGSYGSKRPSSQN
jgi:hypothetical protein